MTVVDADGNVASMTTSNGETSGDVIPGTGVLLNNMLGEDDLHPGGFHVGPPGERVASMMAPTLVLGPDGHVVLALGSGGSKRIRTAIVQVVTAIVAHGRDLAEAVEAPRIHWDGDVVQVEPGLPPAAVAALRRRWSINQWPARNLYFGGVHAVQPGKAGVGDPRRGGTARFVVE
jgi:gamma-glutamyltranspeptidase/glutathione hydrolase